MSKIGTGGAPTGETKAIDTALVDGDLVVMAPGGGKDMVHDFDAAHDQVDLSADGLDYRQSGAQLLKSVSPDDLDESNFAL